MTIVIALCARYKIYWLPYFNQIFSRYCYTLPALGQDFVVRCEPGDCHPPQYLYNFIKKAFPEYNVIVDNTRKPHLITRSEHIDNKDVFDEKYTKWAAPYVSFSAERWAIKRNRYRHNAPPFLKFVSRTPKNDREVYVPFMVWSSLEPVRIHTNLNRNKFAVYISSNCMKPRDRMFALLKQFNFPGTDALGRCSNPTRKKLPESWSKLDTVYAQYLFGFAMENHQIPGYITEKILNVYRGGGIPLYWGDSETVKKYFNPKSFVDLAAFESFEKAAEFVVALSRDEKRLQAMQQEPIFKNNERPEIFDITDNPPEDIVSKLRNTYLEQITRSA